MKAGAAPEIGADFEMLVKQIIGPHPIPRSKCFQNQPVMVDQNSWIPSTRMIFSRRSRCDRIISCEIEA